MAVSINGTSGLTFNDGTSVGTASSLGMRNRIINGAMMIDQRNAGASVTPANAAYTLDRWSALLTQSSKFSIQQNGGGVTPPTGFINYLGVTSLSSYSVVTGDIFGVRQRVEGLNVSDFAWGTASAQAVTLSFWVRSSLTGTFGGAVQNSAGNRSYPFSYVINGSNTWEYKTVTIPGDTTGTWLTTNGVGLELNFGLGGGATYSGTAGAWAAANYGTATGATSVVGTNGATFYLTGVQLEVGSVATPFERRLYTTELQLCQRYYQSYPAYTFRALGYSGGAGGSAGGSSAYSTLMRATPTVSGGYAATTNIGNGPFLSPSQAGFAYTANTSGTGNYSMQLDITTFSAEL